MSTTRTFAGPFDLALSLKAAASFLPAQGPLPTTLRAGVHLDDRPGLVEVRQSGLRLEAIGPTYLTAAKLREIAAWLVNADLDLRLFLRPQPQPSGDGPGCGLYWDFSRSKPTNSL